MPLHHILSAIVSRDSPYHYGASRLRRQHLLVIMVSPLFSNAAFIGLNSWFVVSDHSIIMSYVEQLLNCLCMYRHVKCSFADMTVLYKCAIVIYLAGNTRNSSGDEIANVNFLRRHRTRTTAHRSVLNILFQMPYLLFTPNHIM